MSSRGETVGNKILLPTVGMEPLVSYQQNKN
jgi:hypothetical protein